MEKYKSGTCSICANYFSLLHWHHTVPQALGGVDSLQIPLCSDCHNVLHANANAYVAKIRNGKPITRRFWKTPEIAERAAPYLDILVRAILNPPVLPENKGYKLQVDVSSEFHQALKVLQKELGKGTTLPDAVLYCVAETLKNRGLVDVGHSKQHRQESNRVSKVAKTDLW